MKGSCRCFQEIARTMSGGLNWPIRGTADGSVEKPLSPSGGRFCLFETTEITFVGEIALVSNPVRASAGMLGGRLW